jgi:hypothetical protein
MIAALLRLLFVFLAARLLARVLAAFGRAPRRVTPRPATPASRRRVAGEIVDAEFEDVRDGGR